MLIMMMPMLGRAADDVVLHADKLAFVVTLLAFAGGNDGRAIGSTIVVIGRAVGLGPQHAGMFPAGGHAAGHSISVLGRTNFLEENLLAEVRDRRPYLALLGRVRAAGGVRRRL